MILLTGAECRQVFCILQFGKQLHTQRLDSANTKYLRNHLPLKLLRDANNKIQKTNTNMKTNTDTQKSKYKIQNTWFASQVVERGQHHLAKLSFAKCILRHHLTPGSGSETYFLRTYLQDQVTARNLIFWVNLGQCN